MPITLYETFRALFYSGFYLAHALKLYEAEGLDVRLAAPSEPAGAAKAMLAGETDVMWGGPMRLLQHHDQDPQCPLVGFAEMVTRDPFFVVGRRPNPSFRFADLLQCRVGTVSEVPTPWLCLQEDVRRAGLDPDQMERVTDGTMTQNAEALRAGRLDAVQLFEPYVEQLVRDGVGHIWFAAASRGATSYTTLITSRARLRDDPETALRMTRALYRAQQSLHAHDAPKVAEAVAGFFPDLPREVLTAAIARYKSLGIWGRNPLLPVTGFVRLKVGMLSGGFISRDIPYDACVERRFAEQVIAEC